MKKALYPGSFDPITNGHIDIIVRGLELFDRVVVGVGVNLAKETLFTLDERIEMINAVMAGHDNLEVVGYTSLTAQFAAQIGASAILRGLRAISDFEYEFQMAGMNRKLFPDVETVFLTPAEEYMFISATMVREIARLGGDVSKFVQPAVLARLQQKVNSKR